jgi:hypothetical protein
MEMIELWRVKKFFGMSFDLIDAYGSVLEKYSGLLEPEEALPASKEDLKSAILLEAFSAKAFKSPEYMNALTASFLSLANFQKGLPKKGLKISSRLADASKKSDEELVDAVLAMGPTFGSVQYMSEHVATERQMLAAQWESEFKRFANAYQKHLNERGHANAPR